MPKAAFAVLPPAAQRRLVDHVVVQEGGGVDEFDHRGERQARLTAIAERPAGKKQERGAQTLAAGRDDVLRHLAYQRHIRLEPLGQSGASTRCRSSATGASMDRKVMISGIILGLLQRNA